MNTLKSLVGAGIFGLAGLTFVFSFTGENSCLQCHKQKEKAGKYFWAYEGWKDSAHGRATITCDRCHGGNPSEPALLEAHSGVFPASDKNSLIHFQKVAKTCGACHGAQWIAFQRSTHYQVLQKHQRGPTCGTCHGSMHTTVALSKEVQDFCALCHNERTGNHPEILDNASLLLLSLEQNATLLKAIETSLIARSSGHLSENERSRLSEAKASYEASQMTWHEFDLKKTLKVIQNTFQLLKELLPHYTPEGKRE